MQPVATLFGQMSRTLKQIRKVRSFGKLACLTEAVAICTFVIACDRPSEQKRELDTRNLGGAIGFTHFEQEFELSLTSATNAQCGIKLISVSDDGSTTIEELRSGTLISAKPGEYYAGFGRRGLQLLGGSKQSGSARFMRRGSIVETNPASIKKLLK
jgi:hypothetical protein